jgi:predicted ABC-type ATPase
MILPILNVRPIVVALAGPNGAGKTTYFNTYLASSGLRFVNADTVARDLGAEPYGGARLADAIRTELVHQRESFVFETVFSDPVGAKRQFLKDAVAAGYTVVVIFIGLASPALSDERVAQRVSQGGHDVPPEKLVARFPRTLANLQAAITELPHVLILDNSDLRTPFRLVVRFADGRLVELRKPVPDWLRPLLPAR